MTNGKDNLFKFVVVPKMHSHGMNPKKYLHLMCQFDATPHRWWSVLGLALP